MKDMIPLRYHNGNQYLHRKSPDYRNRVKRKMRAYHAFIQAGVVAQGEDDHGLAVDSPDRLAFIACDINSALLTVDMNTWRVTGTAIVGVEPDVLAFDGHAGRLYVAAESGWVTVLQRHGHGLRVIYSNYLANDAHVVAVDPASGRSYFPVLSGSGGHPAVLVCEIG
jgi:DNA-binding beta-propeller fold protein YncE